MIGTKPAARPAWAGHHRIAAAAACTLAAGLPAGWARLHAAEPPPVPERAQVCLSCHGPAALPANPLTPSINGQPKQFIATELFQFREGRRQNPVMSPMAANLSNNDMNELAAFFSSQKPDPPSHKADPQKAGQAKQLTTQFNCVSCHGPSLTGQQHIPRLAGQQFEYLRAQLRGFKTATRADIDGLMTSAAQPLSDSDIDTLADYLSALGTP